MMMIVLRLLSLLGLKSRWHRHFSLRPPNEVFFQGGRGVGIRGLLARNPCAIGIQPVHTRVDSCGLRGLPTRAFRRTETSRQSQAVRPTSSAWQCRHTAGWPVGTPIHCSSWAPPLTIHADQWTNEALIESQASSRRWLVPSSSSSSAHLGCHA